MELKITEAGIEYLEQMTDLRIDFVKDDHPEMAGSEINEIRKSTRRYLEEHLQKNSYLGYLGYDEENNLVCGAGLLLYSLPPLGTPDSRKVGHVLNFFTYPQYRRMGCGMRLMEFIKASAKKHGLNRIFLNATKMGQPLYEKSGFGDPEYKSMILHL